jgi:ceramide glucosyltransferase
VIYAIAAIAIGYQMVALLAVVWRKLQAPVRVGFLPRVSILKPVRGASHGFYEAIQSNATQVYPAFELLVGLSDRNDAARPSVDHLAREFSNVRVVETEPKTPNAKAGTLIELARAASGDVLVVSDSDIVVPAGYLKRVVAPLADSAVGLVTCAYRARSETLAGRFEALGVATDFGPSTMLAPFVGVDEFALGSTLAFRRSDLERIGGFEAVADYLADDYQIGHRIHGLGLKCVLSEVIVETHLSGGSWKTVWDHQLRWARTIRVSRFGGYIGLPVTFATLWALAALLTGHPWVALGIQAMRMVMAMVAGGWVFGSKDATRLAWLIPFRDLFGAAVWAVGLFGNSVVWAGRRLSLDSEGRILSGNSRSSGAMHG